MSDSSLQIRPARPEDREAWDDFIEWARAPLFFEWAWGELSAAPTSDRTARFIAERDDQIAGVAACLERRRLGVRFGLNPLLTPYCGLIVDPEADALRGVETRGLLTARLQRHFRLLHLQIPPGLGGVWKQARARVGDRRTLVVDLAERSEQAIWESLDASTRRQINKAERDDGIFISEGAESDEVQRLTESTFKKRCGTCPILPRLIDGILSEPSFAGRRHVLAARDANGRLLSVVVSMWERSLGRAYYVHAATDPDALPSGVSSLAVWRTIQLLRREGVGAFDFCGANIPGIARFKSGFGPREETYFDVEWSRPRWLAPLRRRLQGRTIETGEEAADS